MHSITRNGTKLRGFSPSMHIFNTLRPKLMEKVPSGILSSALVHEVRNPLTNINLAIEMLRSTILDDEQRLYLDIVKRSSLRINGLVSDLLIPGKTGEIPCDKQCIHELLDDVLAMAEDRVRLKNIVVKKDYTAAGCTISVNRKQLELALTNIIVNAIEAMPLNNGQLMVITQSINGKCIITIEDNGIGISEEDLEKIFKPLFSKKPGGIGLGLSTTLQILHDNHGRVEVASELGKGTRFLLSFGQM